MEVARLVASWSSCFQENRQIGAVIVLNKRIITTGYNGASSGIESCKDRAACLRKDKNIKSGTQHEICFATHAEQNAIIQAARLGVSIDRATLYCTHQPCAICAKMIINSGIIRIVFSSGYPDDFSLALFKEAGVDVVQFDD